MKKTSKIIFTSILTIIACVSLIAGATFALFTSESSTNIAITSGTVDVQATVDNVLINSSLTPDDPMGSAVYDKATNKLSISKIAPGDYVKFDITIENKSTIPVKWQLQFTIDGSEGKELFNQLVITSTGIDLINTGKEDMSVWQTLEPGVSPSDKLHITVSMPASVELQTGESLQLIARVFAVQGNAPTTDPIAAEPTDPNTYIYDIDEFKAFAEAVKAGDGYNGKTVYLMENIDLQGENWEPIGPFNGTFDGHNQIISNLKIDKPEQDNVGLFSTGAMTIQNLVLSNVEVKGQSEVGAVAGGSTGISVDNVAVIGLIKIDGNYKVGGVIGSTYDSVTNCRVEGTTGSYIKATLKGSTEGDNVGGIIGFTGELNSTHEDNITNCHVSGVTVSGTRKVGGVVGYLHHGQGVSNSSFSNGTVTSTATPEYINSSKDIGIDMIAVGGIVGQTHNSGAAQSIKNNKVSNITIDVPTTYTFATVTAEQKLTSAILGGARECDTSDGIAHAKTILASGNTSEKVTVNAKLKDVEYAQYTSSKPFYISAVTVENVADVLSLREMQFDESNPLNHTMDVIAENRTTVTFAAGDYDFAGIDWKPLSGWRYNYEGNGSTIRNLNMQTAQWRGGFVDSASDCTVRRFTFDTAVIKGEQAAVVFGHADHGLMQNIGLRGNILVDYEIPVEHQYNASRPTLTNGKGEKYPGIGVFVGATANAADKGESLTIYNGCNIIIDTAYLSGNIGTTGGVSNLKSITDKFLFGYMYNDDAAREYKVTNLGSIHEAYNGLPTQIYNEADLISFRESVNGGNTYSNLTVRLMDDIELTEEWIPIGEGNTHNFSGTFDGQGHTISGLKISTPIVSGNSMSAGLFVSVSQVTRLKVAGEITIENISDVSDVTIAGITGSAVVVSQCESDVAITVRNISLKSNGILRVGGVVAWHLYTSGTVENCINKGDITVENCQGDCTVGGVVGQIVTVKQCVNLGQVVAPATPELGADFPIASGGCVGVATGTAENCHSVACGELAVIGCFINMEEMTYGPVQEGVIEATNHEQGMFSGFDFDQVWDIQDNVITLR